MDRPGLDSTDPDSTGLDSTGAWRELLAGLAGLDRVFLEGERAVAGEANRVAGYSFLCTVVGLALDVFVFADPGRPQFVDINAPHRPDLCWGGDNTDASYQFCAVDPTATYRLTVAPGDSAYVSVTVYNMPAPGQWSDRIVGIVNDDELRAHGSATGAPPAGGAPAELVLGPHRPEGWHGPFIELSPDAAHVVTRDYQVTFDDRTRTRFGIEVLDPPRREPGPDERMARGLRAAKAWVDQQLLIAPLPVTPRPGADELNAGHNPPAGLNEVAEPYAVPEGNFGWSARDACYAFGSFELRDDEALVITHRPPACRFWNLNLWDPFMAKLDHLRHRVSVNGEHAVPNSDATVTVVITNGAHGHPNAISTTGRERGLLAFRWFLADEVPGRPTSEVVPLGDAPTAVT